MKSEKSEVRLYKWSALNSKQKVNRRTLNEGSDIASRGCYSMLLFFPLLSQCKSITVVFDHLHLCLVRPEYGKWYCNVLLEVNFSESAMGPNVIKENYNLKQQWWGTTTCTYLWPQQGWRDGWILEKNFETGKINGVWEAALWNDRLTEDIDFSSVRVTKLRVKPQGLRQDYV